MREPLRTIASYAELLKRDLKENKGEQVEVDLEYVTDAAKRMNRLIEDLLLLSRASSSELRHEAFDLNQLMISVTKDLNAKIAEQEATVNWNDLPQVKGDYMHLSRVMLNHLGNAIKYHGDEAPVVEVTSKKIDGQWEITVHDNGIGIEERYLTQIFFPFKRLHGMSKYEGSGVGLSICKKIIERHGGRIWAESQLGSGSRFIFTLSANVEGPLQE